MIETFTKAIDYINKQLPMFHRVGAAAYKDSLATTIELSELFGKPELKFPSIHIAGTNGKGSVANMLASILQEAGYKTGLFTSPHLKDFRERIRINGAMISRKKIAAFIRDNETHFEKIKPSFFELTFALASKYFADEKVDIAVIETGMGGRLDSTNIVRPVLSIITNISLDHTQFLGLTLQQIATQKAGIIKPNVPVLIGKNQVETEFVFISTAKDNQAPIYFAEDTYKTDEFYNSRAKPYGSVFSMLKNGTLHYKDHYCPLSGIYQRENLQTVFAAYDILIEIGYNISPTHLFDGIGNVTLNTGLKGRWQIVARLPLTIYDCAHNEAGIAMAMSQIANLHFRKLHIVLGMVKDKDFKKILALLPTEASYYFCAPNIPRGLDKNVLKSKAAAFGLRGKGYLSVKDALYAAKSYAMSDDVIFVGGSTFVVAEVA